MIHLNAGYQLFLYEHYVCRSVTESSKKCFWKRCIRWMLKYIRCLMYMNAMEFPILLKEGAREKEGQREEYESYVELTRANISWALYWKPIFMTLRPRVLAIFLRSLSPSSVFCVRFERGYVRTCTISTSDRRIRFAYHLSLSFDCRVFSGTF